MPPKKTPPLADAELEVLKVLWDVGSGTVRQINEVLRERHRQWAYTTVLTLLTRLEAKGYVASDKSELAHVFRAVVSREKLLRQRLSHLAKDLCEGTATPLVHALVQSHRFSPAEIADLRQLLDELDPRPLASAPKLRRKPPKK